jgi:UDP:flavonoid glycosyltransferase YjiC (YdhE family)
LKGGLRIIQGKEKQTIGFLPCFFSIGETLPIVKLARAYIRKGGKTLFFSHGGGFEHFATDIGCKIISLQELPWKSVLQSIDIHKLTYEQQLFTVYSKEVIDRLVEEEIHMFNEYNIDALVSSFNLTASISARVVHIPLIVLTSGTAIPAYFQSGFATFPENYENAATRLMPSFVKNRIAQWILLNNKLLVKEFNTVAKRYDMKRFQTLNDILLGDHTLICDDLQLLGIQPTKRFPRENFIGPITGGLHETTTPSSEKDVINHLKRPGRSILFSMGNTRDKRLFLSIVNTLSQTEYNVIVIYTTIEKNLLPEPPENILYKQYISSPLQVNTMVDLAVIHGGRGTVYNAAYSGKPAIGIPMYIEHQYNIDMLVRKGVGLRISKKFFHPQMLLDAIDTIFSEYPRYLSHAQRLAQALSRVSGEEKGADRLSVITQPHV